MIVDLNQGQLKGSAEKSVLSGKTYYSFLGIPYAKPPVGDLRFKPPEPADYWDGIRDGTVEANECIQRVIGPEEITFGSEDCLYLNVYTPEIPDKSKNKAVMVFVHGGGFFAGSASPKIYSPDYLMDYDVIFVAMNYRLHALGFLNLEIPECTGNFGLKDQLLALKWIKDNIKSFGGDPDNITIFGQSAGAAAVHHHVISPLSYGSFNRAIIQSGSCLCPWAIIETPVSKAFELGSMLGFEGTDRTELFNFLKNVPACEIAKANWNMIHNRTVNYPGACQTVVFAPSVEKFEDGAILPDTPEKLIETATPVPMMAGYCDRDGIFALLLSRAAFHKIEEDFTNIIRHNLKIKDEQTVQNIALQVKKFYFDESKTPTEQLDKLSDLFTDLFFYKLYQSVDNVAKSITAPVYVYHFTYDGGLTYGLKKNTCDVYRCQIKGACHTDDIGYLFYEKKPNNKIEYSNDDLMVITYMCKLWTNFAKTGIPIDETAIVTWKQSTFAHPFYMEIDSGLTLKPGRINNERIQFWEKMAAYAAGLSNV